MDECYVIVRLGAVRDLIDLARTAAEQLSTGEPEHPLARCLRGSAAEVEVDLIQPAFA